MHRRLITPKPVDIMALYPGLDKDEAYRRHACMIYKIWRNRPKNKVMLQAHSKVWNEIKYGRLKQQPCELCGIPQTQAHHDDYSQPLKVRWLCEKHHRAEHGKTVITYAKDD